MDPYPQPWPLDFQTYQSCLPGHVNERGIRVAEDPASPGIRVDLLLEGLRICYRPDPLAVAMLQTPRSLILRWDGGHAQLRREGPYIELDGSGPDGARHATYLASDRTILEDLRRIMDTLGIPRA